MSNTSNLKTGLYTTALAAAVLALVPLSAEAADVHGEIVTAATHAGLAAGAADLDTVHMHLHHTLNCLVGPGGTGFDAKQMNPCANSGGGAIPDSSDAGKKTALQNAANEASTGIAETNLAKAQKDASDTAALLKAQE
jgi:hypothetical protein